MRHLNWRSLANLKPRSADWMRSIAPLGGRATRGKRKRRRPWSRRPVVFACEQVTPYSIWIAGASGQPGAADAQWPVLRRLTDGADVVPLDGQRLAVVRLVRRCRGEFRCWLCPRCRRRVFKLYRPLRASEFACRVCVKARYPRRRLDRAAGLW